jgi:hypothetical protein
MMPKRLQPPNDAELWGLRSTAAAHVKHARETALASAENRKSLAVCRKRLDLIRQSPAAFPERLTSLSQTLALLENGEPVGRPADRWPQPPVPESLPEEPDSTDLEGTTGAVGLQLEEFLPARQLQVLREYLDRPMFERFRWTRLDYAAVMATALLGVLIDLFNSAWRERSPIDSKGAIRGWFDDHLHHHQQNNPIDYQGDDFGGRYHRELSAGHDLSRFREALDQTMKGEFRGVRWKDGMRNPFSERKNQHGTEYLSMGRWAAFINVGTHLVADFFSPVSLPLPLSSRIYENCPRGMRTLVHELYEKGFNLRTVSLHLFAVALTLRLLEARVLHQRGEEAPRGPEAQLAGLELQLASTAITFGIDLVWVVAFDRPALLNIPLLVAVCESGVKLSLLDLRRQSRFAKEVRNIHELVIEWYRLDSLGCCPSEQGGAGTLAPHRV